MERGKGEGRVKGRSQRGWRSKEIIRKEEDKEKS